jgi:hypothetical protein
MALATIQETVNSAVLLLPKEKKRKHKEGYHGVYYQKNRQTLLAYSNDYYQIQKLLAPYLKEPKKSRSKHRSNYYQQYEQNNPHRKEYKRQ